MIGILLRNLLSVRLWERRCAARATLDRPVRAEKDDQVLCGWVFRLDLGDQFVVLGPTHVISPLRGSLRS